MENRIPAPQQAAQAPKEFRSHFVEEWLDAHSPVRRTQKEVTFLEPDDESRDRPHSAFDLKSFFRVCSLNLCSAIIGANIVLAILVNYNPKGGSRLDTSLNWAISAPISGIAFLWELSRFILAWCRPWKDSDLVLDIIAEAVLGFGSAICAILAAFQAAQHTAYNSRSAGARYQDVGPCIALAVFLGLLMISSFGCKALSLMELNRRRSKGKGRGKGTRTKEIRV